MLGKLDAQTGWVLCRNLQEIAVPNVGVLPRWAERGRVRPDDYLVHPRLEVCFQAKDDPDLKAIFRKQRMRGVEAILRILAPWQWSRTTLRLQFRRTTRPSMAALNG
jgi:hypothetical protein